MENSYLEQMSISHHCVLPETDACLVRQAIYLNRAWSQVGNKNKEERVLFVILLVGGSAMQQGVNFSEVTI